MLLGLVGTKGIGDKEIDRVRSSIESVMFISSYYYDTFHSDRFMIEDCDIIGIFHNPQSENAENTLNLIKEVLLLKKPMFIIFNGDIENYDVQETKEREGVRQDSKPVSGLFKRLKRK